MHRRCYSSCRLKDKKQLAVLAESRLFSGFTVYTLHNKQIDWLMSRPLIQRLKYVYMFFCHFPGGFFFPKSPALVLTIYFRAYWKMLASISNIRETIM